MHLHNSLAVLVATAASANAFYAYLPPGHTGAKKNVHMGNQISKGFAFAGAEVPMKDGDKLTKATLRKAKRSMKLNKRLNDFKIEKASAPSDTNSAAIDQDGTDFSYFAEVTFGSSPGETVYLLLDTGSSSTWVMGTGCTTTACKSHSTFGSTDSKTLKTGSSTFSIGYNTGKVAGSIVTDSMSIAGMDVQMGFGLADTTSDDFDNYPMDGILGLGRTSANSGLDSPTFIQVLQTDKTLKANLFGVHIDRAADGDANGEITFGSTDSSKYSGSINYVDTASDITDWKISADDIQVDGKSVGVTGRDAIIDTGTTYMFLPPADASAIFSRIHGATPSGDMYHLPCDTTQTIALVFNNVAYDISPKDYVGPSVGGGNCYTHIIGKAAAGDDSTWLLGDTFLKNVYSVFDMDNARIGFGSMTASSGVSSSPSSSPSTSAAPSAVSPTVPSPAAARPAAAAPSSEAGSSGAASTTPTSSADSSSKKSSSSKSTVAASATHSDTASSEGNASDGTPSHSSSTTAGSTASTGLPASLSDMTTSKNAAGALHVSLLGACAAAVMAFAL